jgi:hypothetical protein
VSIQ